MREHRDSLLKLPYPMGCATSSCVEVGKQKRRASKRVLFPPPPSTPGETGENERRFKAKIGDIRSFLVLRYYAGLNRVIKSFKSFPRLFVYEEEEEEESDIEIEIGLPTDVKHVTHIGWDGATTINPTKGWENLQATQEILSLSSSISLRQFELAMSAQAARDQSVCVREGDGCKEMAVPSLKEMAATSLEKENKLENV